MNRGCYAPGPRREDECIVLILETKPARCLTLIKSFSGIRAQITSQERARSRRRSAHPADAETFNVIGCALYKFLEEVVADNMTRKVKTVTRDMTMRELGRMFAEDDFNAYPVLENSHVLGLVTKFDYLNCFAFTPARMVPQYDDLMNRTVTDVMKPEFIYVNGETKLTRVLQLMVEHRVRSIPVIENDKLVGIISREDVMRALKRCADGS